MASAATEADIPRGRRIDLSKRSMLTIPEAAIYLNASKTSIYAAINTNELPAYRIPCVGLRIKVEDFKVYIDNNKLDPDAVLG